MEADTPALRALAGSRLAYEVVRTTPARSAEESADLQEIPVGNLLRTIVIRRGADDYVFVLVPGGRQIDWPSCGHTSASAACRCRTRTKQELRPGTNEARSRRSARQGRGR